MAKKKVTYLLVKVVGAKQKLTKSAAYEMAGTIASEMGCESAAGIKVSEVGEYPKALVHVRGGCVTEVRSNIKGLDVDLFDVENIEEDPELLTEDGESPDIDEMYKERSKGLKVVW